MDKQRLMELAGVENTKLTEAAKSLQAVLKYFEKSGQDNDYKYYDIKPDYVAHWKHVSVTVVGIPKGKDVTPTIHSEERGEMKATEDAIANLSIYKLQQVY